MFASAPSFSYVYVEKATKARPNPMVYAIFKNKANAETAATIVIPGSNNFRMSLMDIAVPEANNEEKERTIKVTEIPLNFDSETVKTVFEQNHGSVERITMTTKGLWQQAYIVFKDTMVAQSFMKFGVSSL